MFAIILLLTLFLTYIACQLLLIVMGWVTVNIQVPLINSLNNLLDIKLYEPLQKEIYCVTLSDDIIALASTQPESIFSGSITNPETGVITGIITGTLKNNNLIDYNMSNNTELEIETELETETESENETENETEIETYKDTLPELQIETPLDLSNISKNKILVDESLD